jgi:hypothetical protein
MRIDPTSELAELLRLAHHAANRLQADTDGEASQVAGRISQHVQYLRKVVDLLRHEIERMENPRARRLASARLKLVVR